MLTKFGPLLLILLYFVSNKCISQYRLPFVNLNQQGLLTNPSLIGFDDGVNASIGYLTNERTILGTSNSYLMHVKWTFQISSRINYNLRSLKIHNNAEFERHEKPKQFILRKSDRHAIGILHGNENLGLSRLVSTTIQYGRLIKLNPQFIIGFGSTFGIQQNKLDVKEITSATRDDSLFHQKFFPLGLNAEINSVYGLGISILNKYISMGYSVNNFLDKYNKRMTIYSKLASLEHGFFFRINHYLSYPIKATTNFNLYFRKGIKPIFLTSQAIEYKDKLKAGIILEGTKNASIQFGIIKKRNVRITLSWPLFLSDPFSLSSAKSLTAQFAIGGHK